MAILTSLISFLLGKRRAASVQDAFRRSKDSYLEFLGIAERRAIAVSPDHRLVWQNAFRLQHLLIKQQYLRFENLVVNHQLGEASRSIASIEERLGKGWAVTEEATLKESLPLYKEISSEIEDIKSKSTASVQWESSAGERIQRANLPCGLGANADRLDNEIAANAIAVREASFG